MAIRLKIVSAIAMLLFGTCFLTFSCRKGPYTPDYYVAVGNVIGKETCDIDSTKDYWLINITLSPLDRKQYGDSLFLNGIQYTNVVKCTGLPDYLQKLGQKILIKFTISSGSVISTGCNVTNPITYNLIEAKVFEFVEVR